MEDWMNRIRMEGGEGGEVTIRDAFCGVKLGELLAQLAQLYGNILFQQPCRLTTEDHDY